MVISANGYYNVGSTTDWIYVDLYAICLLKYSISNWMNLRDADSGKILWQGNEDL